MEIGLGGSHPAPLSPNARTTLHRLCQGIALGLMALALWWCFRSVALEPEFMAIQAGAVVLTAFAAALVAYLVLRIGSSGSDIYWSGATGAGQVRSIVWMELATVGVMLSASAVLHWLGRADPASAMITYLVSGTLVPAAFLGFGLVTWPSRSNHPGRLRLLLIGGLAIGLAAAWTYGAYSIAQDKSALPSVPDLIVAVGALILGATFEEVVFRVLFLTALLDWTGSRFQAVFLSSVAFGLMHVPGALADPVMHGEWAVLPQVAFEYAPQFLMQTFAGLLLGSLWLRTGSITLIIATHAILNLGKAMAYGLLAYG